MLQRSTSTSLPLSDDSSVLLEDQQNEVTALDGTLDEAGWRALLIQIDQEEGGP